MAIKAQCSQCGHTHNLRDDLAGKRFRCKQCQAPVTVPLASAPAPTRRTKPAGNPKQNSDDLDWVEDEDDVADDFIGSSRAGGRRKSPRRKKKGDKQPDIRRALMGVGALVLFFGGGLIIAYMMSQTSSLANWEFVTSPDGRMTVEMPGHPFWWGDACEIDEPVGVFSFSIEKPEHEALTSETDELVLELIREEFADGREFGDPIDGTMAGRKCMIFRYKDGLDACEERIAVIDGSLYVLGYRSNVATNEECKARFFNSAKLNGP